MIFYFLWIFLIYINLVRSTTYLSIQDYEAIKTLYYENNGPNWKWKPNYQMNGKPWNFSSFVHNNPCGDFWQGLFCFANEPHLFYLGLVDYNLTGRLSPKALNFTKMEYFDVSSNKLTGPFPDISSWKNLEALNISYNDFNGTLPDSWSNKPFLNLLYFSNNHFSGSIPSSIYSSSEIQYLNLYNNNLNGSISSQIQRLNQSIYLNFGYNFLTGTVPNVFQNIMTLEEIYFSSNVFHGILPNFTASLKVLWIDQNSFSGPVPERFCEYRNITILKFNNNSFTGTLPTCLSTLPKLHVLQVQCNYLKGNIYNVFNPTIQTELAYIDVSDNAFTGDFPETIFNLPALISIAAVKNCFRGRLPKNICDHCHRNLSVIAMDGLQSSARCLEYIYDPFHLSVGYFAYLMEGSIPECLWQLPKLSVLHLAGNGFTGTIPSSEISSSLRDVSLSHNKLTGTIPTIFQMHSFDNLDLSYNKLYGLINEFNNVTEADIENMKLSLNVNRLSGNIPNDLYNMKSINILNSNVFACDSQGNELPENDPDKDTYICGSSALASSLLSFGFFVFIVTIIILVVSYSVRLIKKNFNHLQYLYHVMKSVRKYYNKVYEYLTFCAQHEFATKHLQVPSCRPSNADLYHRESDPMVYESLAQQDPIEFTSPTDCGKLPINMPLVEENELKILHEYYDKYHNIYHYIISLTLIRDIAITIAVICLFICLPVYLIFYSFNNYNEKTQAEYSTHQTRYEWVTTSAFLTGVAACVVLFVMWFSININMIIKIVYFYEYEQLMHYTKKHILEPTYSWFTYCNFFWWCPTISPSPRNSFRRPTFCNEIPTEGTHLFEYQSEGDFMRLSILNHAYLQENCGGTVASNTKSNSVDRTSFFERTRETIGYLQIQNIKELIAKNEWKQRLWLYTKCFCIFSFNAIICMGMNIIYLYVQNDQNVSTDFKITMQIFLAMFKIFWNIVVIRHFMTYFFLSNRATHTNARNQSKEERQFSKNMMKLHVGMLVFNSIYAPCLATAFTDASCFQDVFIKANPIYASYSITNCLESYQSWDQNNDIVTICTHYTTNNYTTEFTPTFIYYYTCGSRLLTAYIPVYIYIYTMLLIFLPMIYFIFVMFTPAPQASRKSSSATRSTSSTSTSLSIPMPMTVIMRLDGILYPEYRKKIIFERVIRSHSIIALLIQHVIVLLTFGVTAPLLALIVALAIAVDCFMWQCIIVRYIKNGHFDDFSPSTSPTLSTCDSDKPKVHFEPESPNFNPNENESFSPLIVENGKSHIPPSCSSQMINNDIPRTSDLTQDTNAILANPSFKFILPKDSDEAERLDELNIIISDAWLALSHTIWLSFYCAMFFYSILLINFVGDKYGWENGIWIPIVIFVLVVFIRLRLIRIISYVLHLLYTSPTYQSYRHWCMTKVFTMKSSKPHKEFSSY